MFNNNYIKISTQYARVLINNKLPKLNKYDKLASNTQTEYYLYLSKLGDKNGVRIFAINR